LKHVYATFSVELVSYMIVCELWLVQHVDATCVFHTLKHGNIVTVT
jgi:hypothetical protein